MFEEPILHILFLDEFYEGDPAPAQLLDNINTVLEGLCASLDESDVSAMRKAYRVVVPLQENSYGSTRHRKYKLVTGAEQEFQAKGVNLTIQWDSQAHWSANGGKAGFLDSGSNPGVLLLNERPISRDDAAKIPAIVNTLVRDDQYMGIKRAGLLRRRYGFCLIRRQRVGALLKGIKQSPKQVEFEKECRYRNDYYSLDRDIFSLTDLIRYMESKCPRAQRLVI